VRALNTAAVLATMQQAHDEAKQLVEQSLAIASELGDRPGEAWARLRLAFIGLTSDPPQSTEARRSLAMHQEVGDQLGICRSLLILGIALSQFPDSRTDGHQMLERAAQMGRELEDRYGEGFARTFLGWAALYTGDHELAATHLRYGAATEALGPVRGTAIEALARLALERGDPARSMRLLAASAALRNRAGGRPPEWLKRRAADIRQRGERQLTASDADRAWQEGLAMSTEEAVAYALKDDETVVRAARAQPPQPV
jgi:hypothetical protein